MRNQGSIREWVVEDDGSGNVNTWKDELELISRRAYEGWETEWDSYNKDNITKKLIRNASILAKYRKDIDYFNMQMLTGHGIFNTYKKKIGKDDDSRCWDCGDPNDDAEHALFVCPRWINKRMKLENFLGVRVNLDNLVDTVIIKDEYWNIFKEFCKLIMIQRQKMEREELEYRRSVLNTQR
jgi:hypothetical protein